MFSFPSKRVSIYGCMEAGLLECLTAFSMSFPRPAFVTSPFPFKFHRPTLPKRLLDLGAAVAFDTRLSPSTETAMPRPLPPEIIDHVVNQLYDDSATLKTCCLVSKSWIRRTRKHLFANVSFDGLSSGVKYWVDAFPDLTNSPAHHTRTLSIRHPPLFGSFDTILTFCNVERLEVIARSFLVEAALTPLRGLFPVLRSLYLSFDSLFDSEIFGFICSSPLLEDLAFAFRSNVQWVERWNVPPTSPRLSGSLDIGNASEGIRPITQRLLNLPNGIHFAKITVSWRSEEDVGSTVDLVSRCAETLQTLDIANLRSGPIPSPSIPNI